MTARRGDGGFTLVELLVSMALTGLMMGCLLTIAAAARDGFAMQPEAADAEQRLRVAVAMLTRDLMAAGAGRAVDDPCAGDMGAPVRPYRVGLAGDDGAAGTYYRPGVISIAYGAFSPAGEVTGTIRRTYYLKPASPDGFQLMRYDGIETDHPVLEDVVSLDLLYAGVPPPAPLSASGDPAPLDPAMFGDGPWCPDAADPGRYDADLLRIRRVSVTLRVQAQRPFRGGAPALFANPGHARATLWVPDRVIRFDVSPRNLNRRS